MRAIAYHRYGTPDVVALEDLETPTPGTSQVRIKIHAAVVSAADSAFRSGTPWFARLFTGVMRPKRPILGTEFAGEVEAVGEGVSRFRVGDRVFAASGTELGAHAEFICLPEDGALALMPKDVTFADAAAICEGGLTALPFLRDVGGIQSGQTVLINGASGSVGSSAVQLAKHFGAEVTGVCSTANLDLVTSLGADHVIDYTREDFAQNQRSYDLILFLAGTRSLSDCRRALTPHGTLVLIGAPPGRWLGGVGGWLKALLLSRFVRQNLRPFLYKNAKEDLVALKDLIEAGKVTPVISARFPLSQVTEAIRYCEEGHTRGKVVITVAP